MRRIELTILGCHSATPRKNAFPTAQFLKMGGQGFLIDCGEGTQTQLRKYGIKFSKINQVFISHLHGDHCFGLMGLISTFALLKRDKKLIINGPQGIEKMIKTMVHHCGIFIGYPLEFQELSSDKSEIVYEDEKVTVQSIPLKHRIYTNGFLFKEKPRVRRLNIDAVKKYPSIQRCDYHRIKQGFDFKCDQTGKIIPNQLLTLDPPSPKSYAFCSDTAYLPEIIPLIKEVDLLYHEATFLSDLEEIATKTGHSTAAQAATIAQKAKVKNLLIGHYSSRYRNLISFLLEAGKIFPNTNLAQAGDCIKI